MRAAATEPHAGRRLKPRGAHPNKRLSPVRVRALTTPGKYADGNGLYLVVEATVDATTGAARCTKRWILRTVVSGKRCELGLGSARLVSLGDAREEATALPKLARKGVDTASPSASSHPCRSPTSDA